MQIHPDAKIRELKRLRRRGYSINELVDRLSIPKTTVWHHIRNVQVLPRYTQLLKAKRGGSRLRKQNNWKQAKESAENLLSGPHRNSLIALAMLYWAEGSKKRCEFINSDGRMIQTYLTILRKVINTPEDSIKPIMRIFSGMDKKECLNYWSHATKIPKRKFIIRINDGSTRGRTKYGMCRIVITKGGNILKLIHSSVEKISDKIIQDFN